MTRHQTPRRDRFVQMSISDPEGANTWAMPRPTRTRGRGRKIDNDPSVTPPGRFIRHTSHAADEFPGPPVARSTQPAKSSNTSSTSSQRDLHPYLYQQFTKQMTRKTRLHDERGNLVSLSRLFRNGSRGFLTACQRKALGRLSNRPWISFDAQAYLEEFLAAGRRKVLEFGSGKSTQWYAQRATHVTSIEDDEDWYKLMTNHFASKGIKNVSYLYRPNVSEYPAVPLPPSQYDLIMVDGRARDACMETALEHVAPGGVVYLDNADKSAGGRCGDVPRAVDLLEKFAKNRPSEVLRFVDFAPGQFLVQQGLLVRCL